MHSNKRVITNLIAFVIFPFLLGIVNLFKMRFFIYHLGEIDNGVYQFYIQFFSYFIILEAGLETAIYTTLYPHLVNQDYDYINQIMKGARQIWKKIGMISVGISLLLLPLAPVLVKNYPSLFALYGIQLFYSLRISLNYFFAGPHAVAMSENRGYIVVIIESTGVFIASLVSIVLTFFTTHLLLIVISELCIIVCFMFLRFYYIKSKFPWLDFHTNRAPVFDFKKEMSGTAILKLTDMIINNMDLITVMAFIGASATSRYSVYNNFAILFVVIFGTSLVSSFQSYFGKLFADRTISNHERHNRIRFFKAINYFVMSFIIPMIALFVNPFVGLFYGATNMENFIFYFFYITFVYFKLNRSPYHALKVATGSYKQFRKISIADAVLNVVLSIVFTLFFGTTGVLIGTTVAYLLTEWQREISVFECELLGVSRLAATLKQIGHYLVTIVVSFMLYLSLKPYLSNYISLFGIASVTAIAILGILFLIAMKRVPQIYQMIKDQRLN